MNTLQKAYVSSQPLFNKQYVLKSLENVFSASKSLLNIANELDQEENGDKIDCEKLINVIQNFYNKSFLFGITLNHTELTSIGVIGISIEDSHPYVVLEMVLGALFTHNVALLHFENTKNLNLNNTMLKIINQFAFSVLAIDGAFEKVTQTKQEFLKQKNIQKFFTVKQNIGTDVKTFTLLFDIITNEYKPFSMNYFLTKKQH